MNDVSVTTILLVEDEPIIAMDEKSILEKYGYLVIIAYSGEEAIETIETHPEINLILMDIDLGQGMDGTRAAEIILKKHDMPLIFLSSHTEPETVEKTDRISSFGYITKMSGETILVAGIKMAFRLFRARQKEKLKEAALGQNQYFLHKAQSLGKIGHFSYDPESGVFEGSPELFRIYDLDQDHEGFTSITRAFHPDDKEVIFASLDRTIREGAPFDMEHRIIHSDGTVLLVKVKAEMIQTLQGNRLVGVVQDITDIKAAEEELIKSRERFRQLVEYAPCGIILLDMDANITEVNQKQLDYLGKAREDILGKNFAHILSVYGLDVNSLLGRFKKRTTGEVEKFEYTFYEQNGRLVTAEAQTAPIVERGEVTGIMYLINDISERKKLTQTLRLQFEHSPDIILIIDRNYKIEVINHSEKEGFTVDDFIGMDAVTILPVEHQAMVKEAIDRCIETGQRQELEHLIDEGKWAHARFVPVFAGKEVVQVMIISTDITEQKLAGETLKKSEEKFSKAFKASPEIFTIVSLSEGRFMEVNDAFLSNTGFTRDEVIGKTSAELGILVNPEDRFVLINELLTNNVLRNREAQFRVKQGELRDYLISSEVIELDGERCSLNFMMDVTDRNKTEHAIKKNEEKFTKAFKATPEAMSITAIADGRFIEVNEALLKKTGYTRDEIIGTTSVGLNLWVNSEDRQRFIAELNDKGSVRDFETKYYMYNREVRDFIISSEVIEIEGEKCALTFMLDITERKRAEEALRKSEEKFFKAFRASPEPLTILSVEDNRFLEVNDAFIKKSGYSREEVINHTPVDLNFWVKNEDRENFFNELKNKGWVMNHETCFRTKNGEVRNYLVSSDVVELDGKNCILSFLSDITELKIAEETLRKSEEKFAKAFNASPEVITITSLSDGKYIEVNDIILKKTGYTREEVVGHTSEELHIWADPEDRQIYINEMTGNGFLRNFETRFRMRNGEIRDFIVSSEVIEIDGEKCGLSYAIDVTERKRADQARRKSEETFIKVFKASPEALTIVSMEDGRFIAVNDAFLKKAGFTRDEVIGHTSVELYVWSSPEERESFLRELKTKGYMRNYETRYRLKNGEVRDFIVSSEIIELNGEDCILGFIIDITERKKAEEQVKALLAEKELLLKEINHRVKNNMNTISSLLSLQSDTLTEPAAINALNDAKSRIDSIRSLHDRLYKTENYRETSTANYLSSLADDIIANFPGSSRVSLDKEIDDFIIDVKRLQSLGIITNELLTNIMKYAFPDNQEGMVSVRLKLTGNDVVLTVQDNGIGMPESVGFDNSSGFGLMLVHILTQQLRGKIEIERGNGTAFVLTFPLTIILKADNIS